MKEKFLDYFYNNISSIFWSFFVVSGGMVFIFYFAHIGYMPEFDLKSAIAMVSAAAITSIFTIFLFIFTFILPAIFWTEGLTKNSRLRSWLEDENGDRRVVRAAFLFTLSIVGVYIFFALVFLEWRASLAYSFFSVLVVGMLFRKLFLYQGKELAEEVIKFVFVSLMASCIAILPLHSFISLFESTEITSKGDPILVGIPSAIFVVFANIMVIAKPSKWKGLPYYFGIGFLCFIIVFSAFEKFYRIPERTMEIYNFGAIKAEVIVFDEVGCEIISVVLSDDDMEISKVCKLEGATILSRLGKDMYIQVDSNKFTIANEHVVSWSIRN